MNLPFQIAQGIYFEDTGNILRWYDSLQNLKLVDSPEITANGNVLRWSNKICFGGKKINVVVVKDDFHNTNGQMQFVNFESEERDPWLLYQTTSLLFRSHFGEPTESVTDNYGRPTCLWNLNDIQIIIGVSERFVEFEIFGIHKGEIFWMLKK